MLLGAGASVDAGLPISIALTQSVAEKIDARRFGGNPPSTALNAAVGAIVAYDSARGASAFGGVDIERLFSAIQMLATRDELEVSPFIGAWNGSVITANGDGSLPPFWGRDFARAIDGRDSFGTKAERLVVQAIKSMSDVSDDGAVYAKLQDEMMAALVQILQVPEGSQAAYLRPLFELGSPARIATLNYDDAVELCAAESGVSLDTGIGGWKGGFDWDWSADAEVRLLKLHGSIDWMLSAPRSLTANTDFGNADRPQSVTVREDFSGRFSVGSVGIIFGQRGKLRSEGPFLGMLQEFGTWLQETDDLVVIGYSFRDDHINVAVRDWLWSKPAGRVWIIDPTFPAQPRHNGGRASDFRDQLSQVAMKWVREEGSDAPEYKSRVVETARFRIFREPASSAIPKVVRALCDSHRAEALGLN